MRRKMGRERPVSDGEGLRRRFLPLLGAFYFAFAASASAQIEAADAAAVEPPPGPGAASAGASDPGLALRQGIGVGALAPGPTPPSLAPRASVEPRAAIRPQDPRPPGAAARPAAPATVGAAILPGRRAAGAAVSLGATAAPELTGTAGLKARRRPGGAPASFPGAAGIDSAEASPTGFSRGEAAALVESARQGAADAEDFSQALLTRFDGASPDRRSAILESLEASAKASPKDVPLRRTLQRLVVRDELGEIEPRLRGVPLSPERRETVLAATRYRDVRWYHRFDKSVSPDGIGVPDGRTFADRRIELYVKGGWSKEPSLAAHFRALFAHEYTHRLQGEGEVTTRWGVEPPAYATELLRAVELVGLDALRRGAMRLVGEGMLASFESGRAWMRKPPPAGPDSNVGFHYRGFLAGAAYELAQETGHWPDAWAYHRLVSSGADPREAAAKVRAARKQ